MNFHDIFISLGLNEKEAKVYLATLELGPSPASDIALRAKLNRVTAYTILEKLVQKGFIHTVLQEKVRCFSAVDPDTLRDLYRERYNNLKQALPDLRRLHGKTMHPRVRYYEGLDGIKRIYADTLTSKTEILNYADSRGVRHFWPTYDEDYVKERVRKKIYLRGIAPDDEYGCEVAMNNKKNHREIRLVPRDQIAFANEINIYDDKVSIISFSKDELIGMIIESKEIANTQRAIFKMAWAFAKARSSKS